MKEIKFRVWQKSLKRFMSQYYDGGERIVMSLEGKPLEWDEMKNLREMSDDFVVQQYTGLKDKNGVEIYEGDYVLYPHKSGGGFALSEERTDWIQCEVKWKAGGLAAYWGHNDCNIVTFNFKQFIVVGNIFEGVDK